MSVPRLVKITCLFHTLALCKPEEEEEEESSRDSTVNILTMGITSAVVLKFVMHSDNQIEYSSPNNNILLCLIFRQRRLNNLEP